jgi:hypothetical protein
MFLLNYLQAHSMYVDSTNTNSTILGQCIRITSSLPTSSLPTYTSHLLFPHSLPAFTSHLHFPLQFPSSILISLLAFPSHLLFPPSLPTFTSHIHFPHSLPSLTSHIHFPPSLPSSIPIFNSYFTSNFHLPTFTSDTQECLSP